MTKIYTLIATIDAETVVLPDIYVDMLRAVKYADSLTKEFETVLVYENTIDKSSGKFVPVDVVYETDLPLYDENFNN